MKSTFIKFQDFLNCSWSFPVISFLVMLSAYGLTLIKPGLYWDDWQVAFLARYQNPGFFWDYFLYDRPFSAWTYLVTLPILGMKPFFWQLLTLVIRWLGVLAFCWGLNGLWQGHKNQIRWMALLLAIYPGFTQQAVSVAYSQHFITFTLCLVSFALMIWSIRLPRYYWIYTTLALFTCMLHLLTMEYFAGLELLRPVFLWALLYQKGENWVRSVLKIMRYWLPYGILLVAFLVWRFVFYPHMITEPDVNAPLLWANFGSQPFLILVRFLQMAVQDFIQVTLFAWLNTVQPASINLLAKTDLFSWVMGLIIAGLTAFYLIRTNDADKKGVVQTAFPVIQGIVLGFLAIGMGGLAVWSTGRQVIDGMWSDRFSLPLMYGMVILMVTVIEWLSTSNRRKAAVLALFLCLGIAFQFRTMNKYRMNFDIERDYVWQLAWRIPGLKAGTAIVAPELPFSYTSGYSLGFLINILYDKQPKSMQVPFWYINASRYLGSDLLPSIQKDLHIEYSLRSVHFEGSTSQALAVVYPSQGCLRVLDPVYASAAYYTRETDLYPISNPEFIEVPANISIPPPDIFGSEPDHQWCYFYQKADLARQVKNWSQVVDLARQVVAKNFQPKNGSELMPFIEGFAHQGEWNEAHRLTREAIQKTSGLENFLCETWDRIAHDTPSSAEQDATLKRVNLELGCTISK